MSKHLELLRRSSSGAAPLLIALCGLVLCVTLGSGWLAYRTGARQLERGIEAKLTLDATAVERSSEAALSTLVESMESWARQPSMVRILDQDQDHDIADMLDIVAAHDHFLSVLTCVTASGSVLASTDPSSLGGSRPLTAGQIREFKTGLRAVIESNGEKVEITVPIIWQFDRPEFLGVLQARLDPALFLAGDVPWWIGLVTETGDVICQRGSVHTAHVSLSTEEEPWEGAGLVVTRRAGVKFPPGVRGPKWQVAVAYRHETLFSQHQVLKASVVRMTLAGVVLMLGLAFFLSRRLLVLAHRLAERARELESSNRTFSQIIDDVETKKGFTTCRYKPVHNPHIPTCWEVKKCDKTSCPVYGKLNARCWQIAGTHCGGEVQGQFAQKCGRCEMCEVYTTSTADALYETTETFNNMMFILEGTHKELIEARVKAEESSKTKSEFLANMSHEIRTPMNGVLGFVDLLQDTELTPVQRDYLETVRHSGNALLTIINDILDFSKIEAGKIEIETTDFDLRELLEDLADLLGQRAMEKGLELVSGMSGKGPTGFRGDPTRIRQILLNLAGNAIKFTERGEVTVAAEVEETSPGQCRVHLRVSDTGVGIPGERIGALFHPFIQVDGSITRKYGGTGLGLAISKRFVELMEGRIQVESKLGVGTTFTVELPLERQIETQRVPSPIPMGIRGQRILIVDDNANNRKLVLAMLEESGCELEALALPTSVIPTLRKAWSEGRPFDLALLDMQMPEMDGLTLATAIRAHADIGGTPMILLSSIWSSRVVDLPPGVFNETLTKPVKRSALLASIGRVLSRAQDPDGAGDSAVPATAFHLSAAAGLALVGAPPPTSIGPLPPHHAQALRILLAEDNPVNRKLAVAVLARAGHTVDVAEDGIEALQAASTKLYDVLLMDVQMPRMDGYEATRAIRALKGQAAGVPIIAMTAGAMVGDRELCLQAGMDDYVTKPMRPGELLKVIGRWAGPNSTAARAA